MVFLVDKSKNMDHTLSLTLVLQDCKLVLRPDTNNYFKENCTKKPSANAYSVNRKARKCSHIIFNINSNTLIIF